MKVIITHTKTLVIDVVVDVPENLEMEDLETLLQNGWGAAECIRDSSYIDYEETEETWRVTKPQKTHKLSAGFCHESFQEELEEDIKLF